MFSTRWQPLNDVWSEMGRLYDEMNRLFDRYGHADPRRRPAPGYPALDLTQDENNLYVEAELPGMELSDLEILVTGNDQLSIKGTRQQPDGEAGVWHRRERMAAEFTRMITLPQPVDPDKVEASLKAGVLTIKLPKREEARPKKITVKTG